ncbi:MAG: DUF2155 domain-containing protein [Hyphomicrobiales bacterium]
MSFKALTPRVVSPAWRWLRRPVRSVRRARCDIRVIATLSAVIMLCAGSAHGEKIENRIAVFAGLDKISAHVTTFEVAVGETGRFGILAVTPHVCHTRPPTERPRTTAFVEINDVSLGDTGKRVFTGWMFAESPGLNGLEHPVYDIWLKGCHGADEPPETTPPMATAPSQGRGG